MPFSRVCKQRLGKDAQEETSEVASLISKQCERLFPNLLGSFGQCLKNQRYNSLIAIGSQLKLNKLS